MTGKVTLRQVREEAKRVFGDELAEFFDWQAEIVLRLEGGRRLAFEGRSKQAARRFALETLQRVQAIADAEAAERAACVAYMQPLIDGAEEERHCGGPVISAGGLQARLDDIRAGKHRGEPIKGGG
jgi:hypothetical protein